MIKYARTDTHYLLYIYDRIREELVIQSLAFYNQPSNCIAIVLEKSRNLCLKVYEKPVFEKSLDNSLFYRMHKARDFIARFEDESPEFVIPQSLLLAIIHKQPKSSDEIKNMDENPFLSKYAEYFAQIIQGKSIFDAETCEFSENFFNDAKWIDSKLPFGEFYENIKNNDMHIGKVLAEVAEIIKNTEKTQENLLETKGPHDIDKLLQSTIIDENSIPNTIEQIYELSNNSKKKSKIKQKTAEVPVFSEKPSNLNLAKAFKDIGWD